MMDWAIGALVKQSNLSQRDFGGLKVAEASITF